MPSIINSTTSSGLVTSADNSGSLQLATNNGTTAVTIDTSQNVGIGTASPSQKLDVVGTIRSTGTSANNGSSATTGSATIGLSTSARVWSIQTANSDSALYFRDETAGSERGRFDASGNFLFNSGYGSVATAYGCRAWVNFNGTGTVSIRGSGNVSSITDDGTGSYTINYSTAMPDQNYAAIGLLGVIGSMKVSLQSSLQLLWVGQHLVLREWRWMAQLATSDLTQATAQPLLLTDVVHG